MTTNGWERRLSVTIQTCTFRNVSNGSNCALTTSFVFAGACAFLASHLSKAHGDLCSDAIVAMELLVYYSRLVAEDLDLKDADTCDAGALASKMA